MYAAQAGRPPMANTDLRDLEAVVVHSMMQRRPLAVVNGVDVSSIFNEHLHVFVVRRRSEARRHRYLDHTVVAVLYCCMQWSCPNRVCCIDASLELNKDLTKAFPHNLVGKGILYYFFNGCTNLCHGNRSEKSCDVQGRYSVSGHAVHSRAVFYKNLRRT